MARQVHLFRPWSAEHLLAALPPSVKRVAVLDRTKEHGSGGESSAYVGQAAYGAGRGVVVHHASGCATWAAAWA
jgi:pyruvate/2-oxoacid:ferredoxin oxidoreductase alpha subunit